MMKHKKTILASTLLCLLALPAMPQPALAQTSPQASPPPQVAPGEAVSEANSYLNRINRREVHDADPNIYVYSAEFAKRFQMPQEWVSAELKGVDAVAFRVIPNPYKTCGWGGNPKSCSKDEVRCEMDLYFDHQRNPLPWDNNRPERYASHYALSVNFLWDGRRNMSYLRQNTPKRPNDHELARSSPFVDPKTGKGLWWEGAYSNDGGSGGIYMSTTRYDKEIFAGISLVVMSGGCGKPADMLWLSASQDETTAFKQFRLPQAWRSRVKESQKESKERDEAFFKQEGEKAMKALRQSPVPNQVITPIQ